MSDARGLIQAVLLGLDSVQEKYMSNIQTLGFGYLQL